MPYEHSEDADDFQVCGDCIGDPFLKEVVCSAGKPATCTYCNASGPVITLSDLALRVHDVLEACFVRTNEDDGSDPEELIASAAEVGEEIARDVRLYLSDLFGHQAALDGEDDPYGDAAFYQEGKPSGHRFSITWNDFRDQLRERSRFFFSEAASTLETIFGDLTRWENAIRKISPVDGDAFVYRARIIDDETMQTVIAYPARELGPPPTRFARAGRMNAAGISVFYGAQDLETCLAELRPPVSSKVVGGRFSFVRPVCLLDLNALAVERGRLQGSAFDAEARLRQERAAFFRQLVSEISRPVMPTDETFDYLPSQVISEFLATRSPPLDGIIFSSSQTGGKGRNVVLFHHASMVETDDFEDPTADWNDGPEDDPGGPIRIVEGGQPADRFPQMPYLGRHPLPVPTLRLDRESVRVVWISAVRYDYGGRIVRYIPPPSRIS